MEPTTEQRHLRDLVMGLRSGVKRDAGCVKKGYVVEFRRHEPDSPDPWEGYVIGKWVEHGFGKRRTWEPIVFRSASKAQERAAQEKSGDNVEWWDYRAKKADDVCFVFEGNRLRMLPRFTRGGMR